MQLSQRKTVRLRLRARFIRQQTLFISLSAVVNVAAAAELALAELRSDTMLTVEIDDQCLGPCPTKFVFAIWDYFYIIGRTVTWSPSESRFASTAAAESKVSRQKKMTIHCVDVCWAVHIFQLQKQGKTQQ
jgi:hypothetical protein